MRHLAALLLALALTGFVLTSCGDDGGNGDGATATTGGATTTTTSPTTTTATPIPGGELTGCSSPAGFDIAYPEGWHTNGGAVVPRCTQFHPEGFDVPDGTDERVAAVTAYIDPVPFHRAAAPNPERDEQRAATVIDGMQAVRVSFETDERSIYGAGVPVVVYMVDLSEGVDTGPGTLFVDTVGMAGFDFETNVVVLDRVARTVDLTLEGVRGRPSVVAAHEGGGGGFTVTAEAAGDQVCLRIPPGSEPSCVPTPANDGVETTTLVDLADPLLVGVTGADVFRVAAHRNGRPVAALPAPVAGSDVRAFAFTFGPGEVDRLTWSDVTGDPLGEASP